MEGMCRVPLPVGAAEHWVQKSPSGLMDVNLWPNGKEEGVLLSYLPCRSLCLHTNEPDEHLCVFGSPMV